MWTELLWTAGIIEDLIDEGDTIRGAEGDTVDKTASGVEGDTVDKTMCVWLTCEKFPHKKASMHEVFIPLIPTESSKIQPALQTQKWLDLMWVYAVQHSSIYVGVC